MHRDLLDLAYLHRAPAPALGVQDVHVVEPLLALGAPEDEDPLGFGVVGRRVTNPGFRRGAFG